MTDYAALWQPRSFEEAEFQIDAANSGDAFWQWGRDRAAELTRYMPDPCIAVLDYGCGVGRVLVNMPGLVRIGVDTSPHMLAYAWENVDGCTFRHGDGRTIPALDNSIDFVYSLLTLQHMDAADVAEIVKETWRVLTDRGRCYLQFSGFGQKWAPDAKPNRGEPRWTGERASSQHGAHDVLAYTPDIILALAADAGLTVVRLQGHGLDTQLPYYVLVGAR